MARIAAGVADAVAAAETRGRREIDVQRGTVIARLRVIHERRIKPLIAEAQERRRRAAEDTARAAAAQSPRRLYTTGSSSSVPSRYALSALVAAGGAVPAAIGGSGDDGRLLRRTCLALLERTLVDDPPPGPCEARGAFAAPAPGAGGGVSPQVRSPGGRVPSPRRARGGAASPGAAAGPGGVPRLTGVAQARAPPPPPSPPASPDRDVMRSVASAGGPCFAPHDPDVRAACAGPASPAWGGSPSPSAGSPTRYVWFQDAAGPVRIDGAAPDAACGHPTPAALEAEPTAKPSATPTPRKVREAVEKKATARRVGSNAAGGTYAQRTQCRKAKRELQMKLAAAAAHGDMQQPQPRTARHAVAIAAAKKTGGVTDAEEHPAAQAYPFACPAGTTPRSFAAVGAKRPESAAAEAATPPAFGSGLSALADYLLTPPRADNAGRAASPSPPPGPCGDAYAINILRDSLGGTEKQPEAVHPLPRTADSVFDALPTTYDSVLDTYRSLAAARERTKKRQQRVAAATHTSPQPRAEAASAPTPAPRRQSVMELLWGEQTAATPRSPRIHTPAAAAPRASTAPQPALVQQVYTAHIASRGAEAEECGLEAFGEKRTALSWLAKAIAMEVKEKTAAQPQTKPTTRTQQPSCASPLLDVQKHVSPPRAGSGAAQAAVPSAAAGRTAMRTASGGSDDDIDPAMADRLRGRRPGVGCGRGPGGAVSGESTLRSVGSAVNAARTHGVVHIPRTTAAAGATSGDVDVTTPKDGPPPDCRQQLTYASTPSAGGVSPRSDILGLSSVASAGSAVHAARAREDNKKPCVETTGCTRDGCIVRARIIGRFSHEDYVLRSRGLPLRRTCVARLTLMQRRALDEAAAREDIVEQSVRTRREHAASPGGGVRAARKLRAQANSQPRRGKRGGVPKACKTHLDYSRSCARAAECSPGHTPEGVEAVRREIRRLQDVLVAREATAGVCR